MIMTNKKIILKHSIFKIKTRSFWSAPLKASIWENKQRWYGKVNN